MTGNWQCVLVVRIWQIWKYLNTGISKPYHGIYVLLRHF